MRDTFKKNSLYTTSENQNMKYTYDKLKSMEIFCSEHKPTSSSVIIGHDSTDPIVKHTYSVKKYNGKCNILGETNLHVACKKRLTDNVLQLLREGTDPNTQDNAGWSPLHEAVVANDYYIVRLLLTYGADVNIVGSNYFTPLHSAVYHKVDPEIIRLLTNYGADLTALDIKGETALNVASPYIKTILCTTRTNPIIRVHYRMPPPKIRCAVSVESLDALNRVMSTNIGVISLYWSANFVSDGGTTHIIVDSSNFNIKTLQAALLQGICITDEEGFRRFVKCDRQNLQSLEPPLHIDGFAIEKAFYNIIRKRPKLFDGMFFFFCTRHLQSVKIKEQVYSRDDLIKLATLGDAKILKRPTGKFHEEKLYAYHANKSSDVAGTNKYNVCIFSVNIAGCGSSYKTVEWFLDCINNFEIN